MNDPIFGTTLFGASCLALSLGWLYLVAMKRLGGDKLETILGMGALVAGIVFLTTARFM